MPQPYYLDYLYLLTVADICGTNPTLWNSWKDSLLKELYHAAKHMLHKEQELMDESMLIRVRKQNALSALIAEGVASKTVEQLWIQFKDKYFCMSLLKSLHVTPRQYWLALISL